MTARIQPGCFTGKGSVGHEKNLLKIVFDCFFLFCGWSMLVSFDLIYCDCFNLIMSFHCIIIYCTCFGPATDDVKKQQCCTQSLFSDTVSLPW